MASSLTPEHTSANTEQSRYLAELSAMFPTVDYSVLVSVLQAHNGRLDATVEYFMETADQNGHIDEVGPSLHPIMNPSMDMIGQFSDDIGGLPEMLPSFIYDIQEDLNSDQDDSSVSRTPSPSPDSNVNSEDDPLPTYEEACTDADRLPVAVYVHDELVDERLSHSTGEWVDENYSNQPPSSVDDIAQTVPVQKDPSKKKRLKVRKLAGKLKSVRSKGLNVKIAKGKRSSELSLSTRPGYAPLSDGVEIVNEDSDESDDMT